MPSPENDIEVSVIIPVFNDSKRLGLCLGAVCNQSVSREKYEVIVVDNNSTENIRSVTDRYNVRYLKEEKPIVGAARNTGVRHARGRIIAMTDSDCIPKRNWLKQGLKALSSRNNTVIGGRLEMIFNDPKKPTTTEICDRVLFLHQRDCIENRNFVISGNMFVPINIFDEGIFFDETSWCEDREWCYRVTNAGYALHYSEEACVMHPSRASIKQLMKKVRRVSMANVRLEEMYRVDPSLLKHRQSRTRALTRLLNQPTASLYQKAKVLGLCVAIDYVRMWEARKAKITPETYFDRTK